MTVRVNGGLTRSVERTQRRASETDASLTDRMDLMGASSDVLENDTGITICSREGRVSMRSSLKTETHKHFNRG